MELDRNAIDQLDRVFRMNLINGATGIKPANLIGTVSGSGIPNVTIISSVIHLGSQPPLLGFIMRTQYDVRRDTLKNISETKSFTINHVQTDFMEQAHFTSARVEEEVSEFNLCRLTEEYKQGITAPFVKESRLKLGLELRDEIPIKMNGTVLIVGEVVSIDIQDHYVDEEGHIDLEKLGNVGVAGLDQYYNLKKTARFPRAQPENIPDFSKSKGS